jgi:hypothetical protein
VGDKTEKDRSPIKGRQVEVSRSKTIFSADLCNLGWVGLSKKLWIRCNIIFYGLNKSPTSIYSALR